MTAERRKYLSLSFACARTHKAGGDGGELSRGGYATGAAQPTIRSPNLLDSGCELKNAFEFYPPSPHSESDEAPKTFAIRCGGRRRCIICSCAATAAVFALINEVSRALHAIITVCKLVFGLLLWLHRLKT